MKVKVWMTVFEDATLGQTWAIAKGMVRLTIDGEQVFEKPAGALPLAMASTGEVVGDTVTIPPFKHADFFIDFPIRNGSEVEAQFYRNVGEHLALTDLPEKVGYLFLEWTDGKNIAAIWAGIENVEPS